MEGASWPFLEQDFPVTPGLKEVVRLGHKEALRLGHDHLGPEHLLLGILLKGEGLAAQALLNMGLNLAQLRQEVEAELTPGEAPTAVIVPDYDQSTDLMEAARNLAEESGHDWIGTEHLLLALLRDPSMIPAKVLLRHKIDFARAQRKVRELISGDNPSP